MPKLAKLLLAGQSLIICKRKVKPKFFIIAGFLLILLILSVSLLLANYTHLLDKLSDFFSRPLVTSPYWEAVFYP